jgi:hypothetical protein
MCSQVHGVGDCERLKQLLALAKWALKNNEELPQEIKDICESLN